MSNLLDAILASIRPRETYYTAYAPIALALDYCRLGWMPSDGLAEVHHGEWSVLMVWPCACKPVQARAS